MLDSQYKLQIIVIYSDWHFFLPFSFRTSSEKWRVKIAKNFDQRICFFDTRFVHWSNEFFIAASKSCRCKSSRHPISHRTPKAEKKTYIVYRCVRSLNSARKILFWALIDIWQLDLFYERSKIQFGKITFTKSAVYRSFYSNFFEFTIHVRVVYDEWHTYSGGETST